MSFTECVDRHDGTQISAACSKKKERAKRVGVNRLGRIDQKLLTYGALGSLRAFTSTATDQISNSLEGEVFDFSLSLSLSQSVCVSLSVCVSSVRFRERGDSNKPSESEKRPEKSDSRETFFISSRCVHVQW